MDDVVGTFTGPEKEKMLLLSQNKYRKRLSNIPCYCKKCGELVVVEDRYLVPDTNDESGFTIKNWGTISRQIMCSNKICGRHGMFVTYHPSKTLGAVFGLGAHGFIRLPQTINAAALPGIPLVRQICDYPTYNTRTSLCCVNKECLKKIRETVFSSTRNSSTTYSGTFRCSKHQIEHLRDRMMNEGRADEELIRYRERICVGYHCEHNNAAGIMIQNKITVNVVHAFKWTDSYEEKLILGYEEFKDNTEIKQVTSKSGSGHSYTYKRPFEVIWQPIYDEYFKECEFDTSHTKSKKYTNHQEKINSILKSKYETIKKRKDGFIEKVLKEIRQKKIIKQLTAKSNVTNPKSNVKLVFGIYFYFDFSTSNLYSLPLLAYVKKIRSEVL